MMKINFRFAWILLGSIQSLNAGTYDFMLAMAQKAVVEGQVVRWSHTPVILAEESVSPLRPGDKLITCKEVLGTAPKIKKLSNQLNGKSKQLSNLFEVLDKTPLHQTKYVLSEIDQVTDEIQEILRQISLLMVPEHQIKDRTRVLTWKLDEKQLFPHFLFPQLRQIEWARFELFRSAGGSYGTFQSDSSSDRPLRKRLNHLLELFPHEDSFKKQVAESFETFMQSLSFWLHGSVEHSEDLLAWEGNREIVSIDVVTPAQACFPFVSLAGVLGTDYLPSGNPYAGDQLDPSNADRYQMGVGSVVLVHAVELKF